MNKIIEKLKNSIVHDDFLSISYDAAEELKACADAFDAVEPILRLMEENPSVDFGSPGPLVHFVETFYRRGYERKLMESIERTPTPHTLWMLKRIMNGSDEEGKAFYRKVFEGVAGSENVGREVRLHADQYRSEI